MKKINSILALLFISVMIGQETMHWNAYSFKVDGANEEAVVNLLDKPFNNNLAEGVTAYLYSVMFSDSDFQATHQVIFTGTAKAFNNMMSSQNLETQLFFSKLNNFVEEGVSSGNGTTVLNFNNETVFPFQIVTIMNVDGWDELDILRNTLNTLNNKYPRADRGLIHGNIRSGVHSRGTHYFVSGYNSYGDLLELDMNHRNQNPNYYKERSTLNKKIDWDNFTRVRRFSRVLVKKW